jgi:hypothetical protein
LFGCSTQGKQRQSEKLSQECPSGHEIPPVMSSRKAKRSQTTLFEQRCLRLDDRSGGVRIDFRYTLPMFQLCDTGETVSVEWRVPER